MKKSDFILEKPLYRYREYDSNSIMSIILGEIVASDPKYFNDPFDTRLFYKQDELLDSIEKKIKEGKKLNKFFTSISSFKSNIKEITTPKECSGNLFDKVVSLNQINLNTQINNLDFQINQPNYNINDITKIKHEYVKYLNDTFESAKIICFSTDKLNILMWGYYADSYKGFVLEYDEQSFKDNENLILKAIDYKKTQIDYTDKLLSIFFSPDDININDNIQEIAMDNAFSKSDFWEHEQEKRIVCASDATCIKAKPSAIYLGCNMSATNKESLKKIAKFLNIKVYEVNPITKTNNYSLYANEIKI